jgi:hypothetical protein
VPYYELFGSFQIQKELKQKAVDNEKDKLIKRKVFKATACSMMIDTEFENGDITINTILQGFPCD